MNDQTPTPETDGKEFHRASDDFDLVEFVVDSDAARQLERERDALRAAIVKHRDNFPDEALDGEEELWAHVARIPKPGEA